jgi:hypothetical protein
MIPYPDQLKTHDWFLQRMTILMYNNFKCNKCSNKYIVQDSDAYMRQLSLLYFPFEACGFPDDNETYEIGFTRHGLNPSNFRDVPNNYKIINSYFSINEHLRQTRILNNLVFEIFNKQHKSIGLCTVANTFQWKKFDGTIYNVPTETIIEFLGSFSWLYIEGLHVHHTYYVNNLYAWDHPMDCYTVLCSKCHHQHHKNNKIPVFKSLSSPTIIKYI